MNGYSGPEILRPEDVVALGQWLKARHMRIEPSQLITATEVLSSDPAPPPVPELASWLAPIFCTNAAEQAIFPQHYRDWLVYRRWLPGADTAEVSRPPEKRGERVHDGGVAARFGWPIALLALCGLCALLLWYLQPVRTMVTVHGNNSVLPDAEVLTDNPGVAIHRDSAGRAVLQYRRSQLPLTVSATHTAFLKGDALYMDRRVLASALPHVALELKHEPPAPVPKPDSIAGERIEVLAAPPAVRRAGDPAAAMVVLDYSALLIMVAVTLVPLGWWLYWHARRRGFLERMPADGADTSKLLSIGITPALTAYARELRYLSREMRRRRAVPSRVLDVTATLAATFRRGGLPALVFGTRAEPEYLMLVDRTSAADHQAFLADEVLKYFNDQGVCVDRYVFDEDPRFCRHAPQEGRAFHLGPQGLELLFSRHPGARLIIFSDGGGLIDRYTGLPVPWIKALQAWATPLLVTPQPRRMWGLREGQLAGAGLAILPLDGEGLHRLGEILRHERAWHDAPPGMRAERWKAYQNDIDLLLDHNPLPADAMKALLADLSRDLGADGMAWLAACAVYPEIHWAITLTVGDSLHAGQRDVAFASSLAQLARLPWMRVGYMPDWFRTALIGRLTPAEDREVRARLQAFLSLARDDKVSTPGALTLAIATVPPRTAWQDAMAGLAAWLRRQPRPASIRDAIFLRFMSGPRHRLAVDAGDLLARLFYRHGAPLAGPRAWPVLAGMLCAAAVAHIMPPVQNILPPVPGLVVMPVPRLIALNGDGTVLAVDSDQGRRTKTIGGGSVLSCPDVQGGALNLAVTNAGEVSYLVRSAGGDLVRTRLAMQGCGKSTGAITKSSRIVQDGNPGLAQRGRRPTKDSDSVLCLLDNGNEVKLATASDVMVVSRATEAPAACAMFDSMQVDGISGDRSKLLAVTQNGVVTAIPLAQTGLVPIWPTLPAAAAGGVRHIAVDAAGQVSAAVMGNGSVFVHYDSSGSWQLLGQMNATGPLALSADGRMLAFVTARREVEIWHLAVPMTMPVAPAVSPSVEHAAAPPSVLLTPAISGKDIPAPTVSSKFTVAANVYFGYGSTTLRRQDRAMLDQFIARLEGVNLEVIIVVGHDSYSETRDEAQRNSVRIAESVKAYFVSRGIESRRVYTEGKGNTQPVASPATKEGRAKNNRAEIEAVGIIPAPPTQQQSNELPQQASPQGQKPARQIEQSRQYRQVPVQEVPSQQVPAQE